jgi:hypothetical protein
MTLEEAWADFLQMRKEIKHPVTKTAKKKLERKLEILAGKNERMKAAILDQSTEMNWRGLFALKPDNLALYRKSEQERIVNRKTPCELCGKLITESGRFTHEDNDCPNYRKAPKGEVLSLVNNFRFAK